MPDGGHTKRPAPNVLRFPNADESHSAREPPHGDLAEQALLGGLLLRNELLEKAAAELKPEHFYRPLHGRLYGEIARVILAGKTANLITLQPWIEADKDGAASGGHTYLSALCNAAHGKDIGSYAAQVTELWKRRELIAAAERLTEAAYSVDKDIRSAATLLADDVDTICLTKTHLHDLWADEAMDRAIARVEEATSGDGNGALPTGFPTVDRVIKFLPQRVIVLGGATGSGKSAIGWAWTTNIGLHLRDKLSSGTNLGGILGLSLEMSADDLMLRAACSMADVAYESAENGEIGAEEMGKLLDARKRLRSMPLRFCDATKLTPTMIRMKCRQAQRRFGGKLALIVVDHIRLVRPDAENAKSDGAWAMSQVIDTVTIDLCKEFDCSVFILSQLKREVTERPDHAPQITDLAWSSALEQAGHYIALLHRPEYFISQNEPRKETAIAPDVFQKRVDDWRELMQTWADRGELFVRKVRTGRPRSIPLRFNGPTMTFSEDIHNG